MNNSETMKKNLPWVAIVAALIVAGGCTIVASPDRSKIPDNLYQPSTFPEAGADAEEMPDAEVTDDSEAAASDDAGDDAGEMDDGGEDAGEAGTTGEAASPDAPSDSAVSDAPDAG
jgi:hypothetical protein